jgi:hypothetical protein
MPEPKAHKYLVRYELVAYKEVVASSPEEALDLAEQDPPSLSDFEGNEGPEVIDTDTDTDNSNN